MKKVGKIRKLGLYDRKYKQGNSMSFGSTIKSAVSLKPVKKGPLKGGLGK